jgi:BioD-like phosphotransacetylase family protein
MPVLIRTQPKAVYVAATRQHVGKTSTCLGLLQGLTARLERIGFLKPVGQESVAVEGGSLRVDKDVAVAKGTRDNHLRVDIGLFVLRL